jgi:hypothetical protein
VRELADPGDLDSRVVAGSHEVLEEAALRGPRAGGNRQRAADDLRRRQGALHEGEERGDRQRRRARSAQGGEDREAFSGLVVLRQRALERQCGAFGEDAN